MRVRTAKQKPQIAQLHSFPAPIGGWISNRSLAIARSPQLPPGAAVLENWFPIATGVVVRRGCRRWATLEGPQIRAMFSYNAGSKQELFAASDDAIWNVTNTFTLQSWAISTENGEMIAVDETPGSEEVLGFPGSTGGNDVVTGITSGDWSFVQFTTPGGTFLVGVNGADEGRHYDGTDWTGADTGPLAITFPEDVALTTADLIYTWTYQSRIWFIQKDTMDAWYLPVDQVGGELKLFPMGGVFPRGGTLMWGQSWSLSSGGEGGLSDQCVFCTTEGEVASYQGLDPGDALSWSKVGTYRIGRPLGRKALIRAGGDLVIATTVGFVSLQMASQTDYAALGRQAVSGPIEEEWARAVQLRGEADWRCQVWSDGQMAIVAPPTPENSQPVAYAINTLTGAWGLITGWDITAMEAFRGGIFFGSRDGNVRQGWVGGNDEGKTFTANCLSLYDSLNAPASLKLPKEARAVMMSAYPIRERVTAVFGFSRSLPAAPDPVSIPVGNEWDNAIWDQSIWDAERASIYSDAWRSVGGSGSDVSVAVQITSGSDAPLDTELVRVDLTYVVAGITT